MGIFRTIVPVAPPAGPGDRRELANVMLDAGSEFNCRGRVLEELGVQRQRVDRFRTADGRVLERAIGFAIPGPVSCNTR